MYEDVDQVTVLIHRAPEILALTVDRHEDFVQEPRISESTLSSLQLPSVVGAELPAPLANGFVGHDDSSFGQQILNIPEAHAVSVVEPDGMADDFGRKAMPMVAGLASVHPRHCAGRRVNLTMPGEDWDDLLLPEIDRQRAAGKRVAFRADAAFAKPEIYDALEKRDVTTLFACRRTRAWSWKSKPSSFAPPGRPSCKPLVRYKSFRYQAKSWTTPRRIVAKVEHHRGELFPRVGFIVTNMVLPSRSVVRFYNKRGTAEQWIKEGKQATHWTRLSCHRFRANEVRLQLRRPGLQPGQLVAQTGPAAADQALVAHESPAPAGENWGPAGEACAVLLAPAGGRSSDPAAVRRHAAEDLGTAGARRLTRGLSATKRRRQGTRVERGLRNTLEAGAPVGFPSSAASADGSWERNNVR